MHALHDRPYLHGETRGHLDHVSYFLSSVTRPAFHERGCELVPNHFSEVPRILRESTRCSLVLAAAAPMDVHGYFSLGTNCDYVAPFIGSVPFFLEVNERMPRTFGANQVHVDDVVGWTAVDRPLVEVPPTAPSPLDELIAAHIAPLIPDGATIQAGIGAIPNALLAGLAGHRDLGVHTELFSDALVDLIELGVVTGAPQAAGSRSFRDHVRARIAAAVRLPARERGGGVPPCRPRERPARDRGGGLLRLDQRHHRGRPHRAVRLGVDLFFKDGAYARFGHWALHQSI